MPISVYIKGVIIVAKALFVSEEWGMRSTDKMKVNVLEMKYLRSLVGLLRMN